MPSVLIKYTFLISSFQVEIINSFNLLYIIKTMKRSKMVKFQVFNEIKMALIHIEEKPDISVTLLSSQCGTLCSSLDLSILLDDNSEIRHKNAYDLADSVR